jgi:dienelactone hydrolase
MLVILGGRSERVNRTALPYVAAAQAAGKPVRATTYPTVDHTFHNDSLAARYDRAAAGRARAETLASLGRRLR